jgi:hypothetical protein
MDVLLPLGFWTVPRLSYQLLTATAHNDWAPSVLSHSLTHQPTLSSSKSKLCYDWQSFGKSVLVSSTHLGPKTIFVFLSDSCKFVDVRHPLWQQESIVYNCCWSSPAQSFSGPSPTGLWSYFTLSDPRHHRPGGPGPHIYIPNEQGSPVISPGTGFPFRYLLWLIGLWWRYWNLPPCRDSFSSP